MIARDDLLHYLNQKLDIENFEDYGPNGLQIEGKKKVKKIITAVSASLELFTKAVELDADMILVHHGLLWDRDSRVIKGSFKNRVKKLLDRDISLLAYHLPLDKHSEIGNNALAAKRLDLNNVGELGAIGIQGQADFSLKTLVDKIENIFQPKPLLFSYGPSRIKRIGYCSGGAAKDLALAIDAGLDAFITGEAAEPSLHLAKEGNIHFIAAGHYATERLGIRALGEHLEDSFNISSTFVDIPNPV